MTTACDPAPQRRRARQDGPTRLDHDARSRESPAAMLATQPEPCAASGAARQALEKNQRPVSSTIRSGSIPVSQVVHAAGPRARPVGGSAACPVTGENADFLGRLPVVKLSVPPLPARALDSPIGAPGESGASFQLSPLTAVRAGHAKAERRAGAFERGESSRPERVAELFAQAIVRDHSARNGARRRAQRCPRCRRRSGSICSSRRLTGAGGMLAPRRPSRTNWIGSAPSVASARPLLGRKERAKPRRVQRIARAPARSGAPPTARARAPASFRAARGPSAD